MYKKKRKKSISATWGRKQKKSYNNLNDSDDSLPKAQSDRQQFLFSKYNLQKQKKNTLARHFPNETKSCDVTDLLYENEP